MRYVTWKFIVLLLIPSLATGCSLRILGVDKGSLTSDADSSSGINAFSVLGASGGTDASADAYLTDGTTVTAEWVDTTGEDSYEVKVLDSSGSTTVCGPATVAADTTRCTFSSCALSHALTYRIQVTAKNSASGAAQSAQATFQVGPFLSVGDLTVNEWGVASIPVSLSYASASPVSVQYVTVDSSALSGSDYLHSALSTLTIPAGQTSAMISIPILTDRAVEASEDFRIELSSPSGAGLLSTSARVTLQDNDLAPASGFTQITAGGGHNCALTGAGAVKCWGINFYGQIGDNSLTQRNVPTDVIGLSSGVIQVSAGGSHTCAITSVGAVKCWGLNSNRQIGDNSSTDRLVPTDVSSLSSGVIQVSAGGSHTCAITSVGAVKCWGRNLYGQIGDNSVTLRGIPTDVFGLSSGVIQIATGTENTCAITSVGAVKCWGRNNFGQIGDNTMTDRIIPTDVSGLSSGVTQIAMSGNHVCALTSSGAVKCWGRNAEAQLGDNSTTQRLVPTDVFGLSSGVTQIAMRSYHSCALTSSGAVLCWGDNSGGQLGDNTLTQRNIPTAVSGLSSGVIQITTGDWHSCALISSGATKCWGATGNGQTGDNGPSYRSAPIDTLGLSSGITQVAAGFTHNCALTSSGAVKCWGKNFYGQLGNNSTSDRGALTDVSGLSSGVIQISAGKDHSCALTSSGGVKCWGDNSIGQLGDNSTTQRNVPTDVSGLSSGVVQIAAGFQHTCALSSVGGIQCWGHNGLGQVGDNSATQRNIPTAVSGLSSGVIQISTGKYHTCALTSSGAVKCWGYNSLGQIGDNSTTLRYVPTDVSGLSSGATQITAGSDHTCALTASGAVKCWGDNGFGQLGDNSTTPRIVPTDVLGLSSGITQLATGAYHSCVIASSGAVKCWGMNSAGQLGDNTLTQRNVPTDVSGLSSGATLITGGISHTCALTSSGAVKCWGSDGVGQIGEGYSNAIPQYVLAP